MKQKRDQEVGLIRKKVDLFQLLLDSSKLVR